MTEHTQNNKRIAKNAIFLYIRMLVMMVVSLFTFRELLKQLGVEDYGTYNVVGGVVILFSFLSNAMTQSNQRFLAYYIGIDNQTMLKKTFSMIINVQLIIAAFILIMSETVGLWFINKEMNFPPQSMFSVNCVYQFSILTFLIQITQIPYTSAIIAHESMSFFSYASIAEALLKLGIVLLLGLFSSGKLILYSIFLSICALTVFVLYRTYCKHHFSACIYVKSWDGELFKKLFSFSGWNMLGGMGSVGTNQGINILFNIFGGVVVNAAQGVAHQVNAAVSSLIGNMQTAFNPQIIKSYAAKDITYFNSLIFRATRLSFLLIFIVGLPLIVCADFILNLWLTEVPEYAVSFAQLTIIYCMFDALSGPLWTANQAIGKVKQYMVVVTTLSLSNIPIAFILLKAHYSPVYVLVVRIVISVIMLIYRILFLKLEVNFPLTKYFNNVLIRTIVLSVISFPIGFLMQSYINQEDVLQQISLFATTFIFSIVLAIPILLNKSELQFLKMKVISLRRLF